jgi:hypothetical protein
MLTEVTFMHQRAFVFGAYWSTQTAISSLLNTASSYEATITWRWYYVSKFSDHILSFLGRSKNLMSVSALEPGFSKFQFFLDQVILTWRSSRVSLPSRQVSG